MVAAFGVGSRIESMASIVVLALSMTLPPFISQNFGAGQVQRVEQAYRSAALFVLIWQAGVALLLWLFSSLVAGLFSSEYEVQIALGWYISIMPLGYGLQAVVILTNSSFNALHKPQKALMLSVARFFIFFIPLAFIGGLLFGFKGLFIGAVVGNLATALLAWGWFNRTLNVLRGSLVV